MFAASPGEAQVAAQNGILSCDVSPGIGLFIVQKQSMTCTFRRTGGGPAERYTGTINDYGIELGAVQEGHLVWAVAAATQGATVGALSRTYAGIAADAAAGAGVGASALIGGTGRSLVLQPLSAEGEVGINIAAGVRTVRLDLAQ
jgi:hypothetical protein